MKINAIEMLSANSKMNLRARNDQPVPVGNPTDNSENVMKALTMQGQNNMAFQGSKTAIAKHGVKAVLAAMLLAATASCTKPFDSEPIIIEGKETTVTTNITVDLSFMESLINALMASNSVQKEQLEYLKLLYEQAKEDSKAANQFYEFAYDYMMNDADIQQKIYDALKAQGYSNEEIVKFLADMNIKIETGEMTFIEAMKIIQGLLGDISNKLDLLKDVYESVINIEGLSQTQISELQKLYEQAQKDSAAASKFYQAAYNYMMNDSFTQQLIFNSLQAQGYTEFQIMKYLDDMNKKLDNGEMTFEEAMKVIQELLGNINTSLDEIKEAINKFHDDYVANEKEAAKQRDAQIKLLQGIWTNGNISNYQQAQLIYGQSVLIDKVDKQTKSLNDIKNQILKLNIDMNTDFKALAAQLGMSTAALMNVINDLGLEIKDITGDVIDVMNSNTGDIINAIDNNTARLDKMNMYLAKITRYSSMLPVLVNMNMITNAELNNIARLINNLEVNVDVELSPEMFEQIEDICNKLDAILGDIQGLRKDMNKNQTAIYNAILDGNKDNEKLAKLIEESNNKSDVMIAQHSTIIKLLESMDKKTATIEEIAKVTGMDVADIKAYLKDLKIDVTIDDIDLKDVTDAINKAIDAINANTAYLKELGKLADAGFKDVMGILKNIDKHTQANGDILASIDAKLALANATLNAIRSEVEAYDKASLAKLDEILQAIKDHKCDCKGSEIVAKLEIIIEKINNHEGIIEDLDDLFN